MLECLRRIGIFNVKGNLLRESILSCDAFRKLIAKERSRSDRGDHHYSLLVLTLNLDRENNATSWRRIIQKIRGRIRNLDEIGWYDSNRLGIILPYTSKEGANQLAHHICETVNAFLNTSNGASCEVYCYNPTAVEANCNS